MATLSYRGAMSSVLLQIFTAFVCLVVYSSAGKISANFILGDSLVEAGNNDYIVSLSKANYPPNGIDFGRPSGRYTNGRTIVDILGQQLGFKDFAPPYLAPTTKGPVILQGVNYASGGGGILNETGQIFGGRINLDAQIDYFANTRQDIIAQLGFPAAMQLLETALFSVTMGSNDFINNYLVPVLSTVKQRLVSPEMFVASLISRYRLQLTRIYNLGARNFVLPNVGPIGCIPYQRDVNPLSGDDCIALPNQLAQSFNIQLKNLLIELEGNLMGSRFIYADVYHIVADIIQNYTSYGFQNANSACCSSAGRHGGIIPCGPGPTHVCPDRSKYVFWDAYHPSDASNVIIAQRLMDGGTDFVSPINLRQLLES